MCSCLSCLACKACVPYDISTCSVSGCTIFFHIILWIAWLSLNMKCYAIQFCPVGAMMFHADWWTNSDMTMLFTVVQVLLKISFRFLCLFRMLIHPSSGACDLFVELFHGLYCSGSMCVGVMLWFWLGWCGIRMQAKLTSETRWALNSEIIKQVTYGWSLFIQLVSDWLDWKCLATFLGEEEWKIVNIC